MSPSQPTRRETERPSNNLEYRLIVVRPSCVDQSTRAAARVNNKQQEPAKK